MNVMLITPDGARIPLRLPEPNSPVLLCDAPLSCSCKVPVHVCGVEGTLKQAARSVETANAACWECSRPLGTLEIRRPVLFMGEVDEGFPESFRGRVYDGSAA